MRLSISAVLGLIEKVKKGLASNLILFVNFTNEAA
jgi:hypothetical protein